jgi:hypothetical protein
MHASLTPVTFVKLILKKCVYTCIVAPDKRKTKEGKVNRHKKAEKYKKEN